MKYIAFIVCLFLLMSCNAVKFMPYDAVIVPGVPYYSDSISTILQVRIKWSIYLYKYGLTKNIIYSGADVYSPYYESKIMALIAKQNGIPDSVIYCDTIAQHGTENLYYGYVLAKKLGFNRVAIATDPFQSAMLFLFRLKMDRKFKIKGGLPVLDAEFSEVKEIPLNITNIPDSLAINPHHSSIFDSKTRSEIFFGSIGGNITWKD